MNQELQTLEAHMASGRFKAGVARGRWQLLAISWPYAYVNVFDRQGRATCIRFDCTGYPASPPQGTPWDYDKNQQLPANLWPCGGRVSQVFNPNWQSGAALYIPCDRMSIAGHSNWYTELPHLIWNASRGLLHYIEALHEVLQSRDLQSA